MTSETNEIETADTAICHHRLLAEGQRWIRSAETISSVSGRAPL